MRSVSLRDVPMKWRAREPFNANGTLRGVSGSVYELGRMGDDEREIYRANSGRIVFTVISYATPIAWVYDDGTEYKTARKYSVTTSKHRGRLY